MKNYLKKLFVPLLASAPVSSVATKFFHQGTPIFMIHRLIVDGQSSSGVSPEHLRHCLNYLVKNGYTFVSLDEVIRSVNSNTPLPEKSVCFTMDDGFIEQGNTAIPIFIEFNCPLTFFVIVGFLDNELWPWDTKISFIINNTRKTHLSMLFDDEQVSITLNKNDSHRSAREIIRNTIKEMDASLIPDFISLLADTAGIQVPESAPDEYLALNWDMVREYESKGIRFAPHSMTHRILSKLDKKSAENEITTSWSRLKTELSNPIKVFCYPTGRVLDFGPREIQILKNEGFLGAVTTIHGYVNTSNLSPDQAFCLPRFELPDNMMDFMQYCSWIEHAKIRS
ncbi:MAG: polysaccharide deacetylase family protein [Gammaproteobacteria bacterium]|nr:polysaccharide deacetylase family protein [Gammaproteobacteria bacterium]